MDESIIMWGDLLPAILTFLAVLFGGGVIVTLLKGKFQLKVHKSTSENEFRSELLSRVDHLDNSLVEWKEKYFTILEDVLNLKSTNKDLESRVKYLTKKLDGYEITLEYEHFFKRIKAIVPIEPSAEEALHFTYTTTELIEKTTKKTTEQ